MTYTWFGSPRKDFTVKSYSLDGPDILNAAGETNMLHTDGSSPSEFEYVSETWAEGRATADEVVEVNRFMEGYTGCLDSNLNARDSYGDGCDWYVSLDYCGMFDDADFTADDMCCSCGGGCFDTHGDATDANGYGCEYYNALPHMCGENDTEDFIAADVCCSCQTFDQWVKSVTESTPAEETEDNEDEDDEVEEVEEEEESSQPSTQYEIDEDFDWEVTEWDDVIFALDYYSDFITRIDVDDSTFGSVTEFNYDIYPDGFVGIIFSSAELTADDAELSTSVADPEDIVYEDYYFANGISDEDGGYHWLRFYYLPDLWEDNEYGESATITETFAIGREETEFTLVVTLRSWDDEDDEAAIWDEQYDEWDEWDTTEVAGMWLEGEYINMDHAGTETENGWHFVYIYADYGYLWWENSEGVYWTLIYDEEADTLMTGTDCPYGEQELTYSEVWDGERGEFVITVNFLDEPYMAYDHYDWY